ncbi:hypothetical protein QBC46DRAFT_386608 [Diplogelasinospora grovesii]|uniref:Uncharacterized protein n=1 Tax=Diplogelasinospora grovesii TaxID=303347 RepID=A0AAN6S4Q3_9PEZI|nr:hypothetical protein QBC46DRAFT_386608 [Diplogelasinospora grovesii]
MMQSNTSHALMNSTYNSTQWIGATAQGPSVSMRPKPRRLYSVIAERRSPPVGRTTSQKGRKSTPADHHLGMIPDNFSQVQQILPGWKEGTARPRLVTRRSSGMRVGSIVTYRHGCRGSCVFTMDGGKRCMQPFLPDKSGIRPINKQQASFSLPFQPYRRTWQSSCFTSMQGTSAGFAWKQNYTVHRHSPTPPGLGLQGVIICAMRT